MVVEKVFINGGEIYKISPPPNGPKDVRKEGFFLASQYVGGNMIQANYLNYDVPYPDDRFGWIGIKKTIDGQTHIKKYYKSVWYCQQSGVGAGYDTSGIDVCPSINELVSVAEITSLKVVELFFNIIDANNMQEIANYYGLPTPLNFEDAFNTKEHNWTLHYMNQNGIKDPLITHFKMGSIKFIDGVPTYFKYYKYVPS